MGDPNETVTIEMSPGDRLKLDQQINNRMEKLGHARFAYEQLGLGFYLPADWPGDANSEITLAQLTVLAVKLRMRIIIANLDMVPQKEDDDGGTVK